MNKEICLDEEDFWIHQCRIQRTKMTMPTKYLQFICSCLHFSHAELDWWGRDARSAKWWGFAFWLHFSYFAYTHTHTRTHKITHQLADDHKLSFTFFGERVNAHAHTNTHILYDVWHRLSKNLHFNLLKLINCYMHTHLHARTATVAL